ncbi:hypothetical protein [Bacillus stercoris]
MFYQDLRIATTTSEKMDKVLEKIEKMMIEDEDVFYFEYTGEDDE